MSVVTSSSLKSVYPSTTDINFVEFNFKLFVQQFIKIYILHFKICLKKLVFSMNRYFTFVNGNDFLHIVDL